MDLFLRVVRWRSVLYQCDLIIDSCACIPTQAILRNAADDIGFLRVQSERSLTLTGVASFLTWCLRTDALIQASITYYQ